MTLPRATLAPGREKSLRQRHPWVFASSIAKVDGAPGAGKTVALHAANGASLATAAWSPKSNTRTRVWSFEAREVIAAIVGRFGPSPDHPVAPNFPEGDYLKGLLVRKNA